MKGIYDRRDDKVKTHRLEVLVELLIDGGELPEEVCWKFNG